MNHKAKEAAREFIYQVEQLAEQYIDRLTIVELCFVLSEYVTELLSLSSGNDTQAGDSDGEGDDDSDWDVEG